MVLGKKWKGECADAKAKVIGMPESERFIYQNRGEGIAWVRRYSFGGYDIEDWMVSWGPALSL